MEMQLRSKCYELAEAFLRDEPKINTQRNREELAQQIQDVIGEFVETQLEMVTGAQAGAA